MAKLTISAALIGLCSCPLLAADGVLIVEKTTTGGKVDTHQIQVDRNRIRVETSGPNGEKQAFVFDGAKQVMWTINYDKKSYSEMTKADVDRLGGQMSDAMAKLQAQMQSIPPEQRAQMEKMMQGRMPSAPAKTEYKKTGTATVGKWTCATYEGYRNNEKTSELCAVEPAALGLTPDDFAVTEQLQAFFSKLMPQRADSMFRFGRLEDQGFSGVPVRRVSVGPQPSVSEITDVTRKPLDDAMFAVPAGFQKEASPFGRRPGGGE